MDSLDGTGHAGKRSLKRARVLLSAKIRTAAGAVDVRLRDLSRKGALIECKTPLAVGDRVVFSRGRTVVPARIAWTGGNRVGLEFDDMIDETEVLVHVTRRPAKAKPEKFRRPRIASEDRSDS